MDYIVNKFERVWGRDRAVARARAKAKGSPCGKGGARTGAKGKAKWTSLNRSTGTMCLWLTNCRQTDRQTWLKRLPCRTPFRVVIKVYGDWRFEKDDLQKVFFFFSGRTGRTEVQTCVQHVWRHLLQHRILPSTPDGLSHTGLSKALDYPSFLQHHLHLLLLVHLQYKRFDFTFLNSHWTTEFPLKIII